MERVRSIDQQILAAAVEAFGREGFEAAQMERIAKAAGITKVTLYRRFANKADLLHGVVAQLAARLASIGSKVAMHGEPIEDLRRLVLHYRLHAGDPEVLVLQRLVIAQLPYQPSLRLPLGAIRLSYVEPVDTLLLAAMARRLIVERPVERLRELIFDLLVNDISSLALYDFASEKDDAWFDERWQILLHTALAPPGVTPSTSPT